MKKLILSLVLNCLAIECIIDQDSSLQKQEITTRLVVHGIPLLILKGELDSSSVACPQDTERIFPKLKKMGLNTILVPVYWDLAEPVEGQLDSTPTDEALQQARENDLEIVFLRFGVWKSSVNCYTSLWFKENRKKYPRAYTQSGEPLEIANAFSEAVYKADYHAFSQWMQHVVTVDKEEGTVTMIQTENEAGMLGDARDYSREANRVFSAPVPVEFMTCLQKDKKTLHPQTLKKWES